MPHLEINEAQAFEIIREVLEADDGRFRYSSHVKKRMKERSVTPTHIRNILASSSSSMVEGPYQEPNGVWKCNVRGVAAGRHITVVVAIDINEKGQEVILVTVFS